MRVRWAAALMAALVLLFSQVSAVAFAADPVTLGSGYVLDQADVLTDAEEVDVQAQLEQFRDASGLDLWVVYVGTFENPSSAQEWANQTALDNGLGPSQYLLAVATDARQYYLSGDSEGPVSPEQLTEIEQQAVQPALADGDMAGAAVAAADGLADAAGGGTGGADPGGGFGAILIIVSVVALIAVIVYFLVRSRRKRVAPVAAASQPAEPPVSIEDLERRAASALVQTDDAIRTSEQELGFARAQFGDAATAEFAEVLTTAKDDLAHAFTLQQQLDDHIEDTPEQVRSWNTEILELCAHANTALDEKAEAFDELRELEQNAPEALARLQEDRTGAADGIDDAAQRLQVLAQTYAPEALATVADNPEQARERLAFADEQLAQAQASIGAGDGAAAAISIRAAEEAIGQADLLETAVHKLAADLSAGESEARALIADLEGDLAGLTGLPDADGRLAQVAGSARAQIDSARENLAGGQTRPLATLRALESVNTQLDGILAGARDAQARQQRAQQVLGQTILQAQAQMSAAENFITARRGAVGSEARTRLAQAGASLTQAQQLQHSDAATALQHAQRAEQLAGQAIQSAQRDVGAYSSNMGGPGAGHSGGGTGMMGAMLGGIVINSLLGGGGRSRRRSSGMLGGMGGRSRGGFGGGFSPGSFGGGGTRGRRGGGRF